VGEGERERVRGRERERECERVREIKSECERARFKICLWFRFSESIMTCIFTPHSGPELVGGRDID